MVTVLQQVDALPRAERGAAARHGDHQRRAHDDRLHVRGHVVGPLVHMRPVGGVLPHGGVEPGVEITPDVGARVLVERE